MANTDDIRTLLASIKASRPFESAALSAQLLDLASSSQAIEQGARLAQERAREALDTALHQYSAQMDMLRAIEASRAVIQREFEAIRNVRLTPSPENLDEIYRAILKAADTSQISHQIDASLRAQYEELNETIRKYAEALHAFDVGAPTGATTGTGRDPVEPEEHSERAPSQSSGAA